MSSNRPAIHPFAIVLFGTATFALGIYVQRQIAQKAVSDMHKWGLGLASTALLGVAYAGTQKVFAYEVDIEVEKQLHSQVQAEVERFEHKYAQDLQSLRDQISKLPNLPDKTRQRLQDRFAALRVATKTYRSRIEACQQLSQWLEHGYHRHELLHLGLKAVRPWGLSPDQHLAFAQDMGQFLSWMQRSFAADKELPLSARHATAIARGVPEGVETYRIALQAMLGHETMQRLADLTPDVKEMVDIYLSHVWQVQQSQGHSPGHLRNQARSMTSLG